MQRTNNAPLNRIESNPDFRE